MSIVVRRMSGEALRLDEQSRRVVGDPKIFAVRRESGSAPFCVHIDNCESEVFERFRHSHPQFFAGSSQDRREVLGLGPLFSIDPTRSLTVAA